MEETIKFSKIDCCKCNFLFAIPLISEKNWRKNRRNFKCPNCGCDLHFPYESEEDKLRRLLKSSKDKCEQLSNSVEYYKRRGNAYKGHFNSMKKARNRKY